MLESVLGMEYWRWAAVIAVIAIGFAVNLIVRTVLRGVLRSTTHADAKDEELVRILKLVPRPAGAAAGGAF